MMVREDMLNEQEYGEASLDPNGFHDERINHVCGRIYRRGILLAVLYAILFTVSRLLLTGGFGGPGHYLTEGAVMLSGCIILLVDFIRWGLSRDERAEFERHRYYLAAGKVFLVAVLAGYALSIPLRARVQGDFPVNELILHLETLGCVYFAYALKRHEVSFNYTFIGERGWGYYGRVLKNIGKLALILLIPFGTAALLDLVLYQSFTMHTVILFGYVYSTVGLGLEYLLLSTLEKLNYDEEAPRSLKMGTRIAFIIAIGMEGVSLLLRVGQNLVLEMPALLDHVPMGTALAAFSTALNRWSYPCIIITALSLCLLMEQVGFSRRVRRGVCGYLAVQAVDLALRSFRNGIAVRLERQFDDPMVMVRLSDAFALWSFLVWLLSMVFTCLWLYGLIRDCGASKLLWLTVGLAAVCQAVGIFFNSQSMSLAYAITVSGGGLVAATARLLLLEKGRPIGSAGKV